MGSITSEAASDGYTVQVLPEFDCEKLQLISFRFSTGLLQWHGKEVGYSWNSPTCTWA